MSFLTIIIVLVPTPSLFNLTMQVQRIWFPTIFILVNPRLSVKFPNQKTKRNLTDPLTNLRPMAHQIKPEEKPRQPVVVNVRAVIMLQVQKSAMLVIIV